MFDLKNVEVKGSCGEKYRGTILEILEDTVKVTYDDASDIICTVPIEDVYNIPYPMQSRQMSNLPELMPGSHVDVLIPSNSFPGFNGRLDSVESKAWWPAIVKKRQGDVIVVDLLNLCNVGCMDINPNNTCVIRSEIVDIDFARFRTESISFSKQPRLSFKVEIPDNLRKCFIDSQYESELRRWCGEPVSFTKASDNSYILVMSTESMPIHKARLISKKWVQQWSDKYELTKQLEETRYQMQPIYEDEFSVHPNILRFALGVDFGYLKAVSKLPDVVSAQMIDNIGKFSVVAKTEDALKIAREKLEIKEEIMEFDRKLLGILLSENYHFFKEIVKWTDLFRIMIVGSDAEPQWSSVDLRDRCVSETDVLLSLTGTQSALEKARQMLEFAAVNLDHLISLRPEMAEIDNELLNDVQSHQNRRGSQASKNEAGQRARNTDAKPAENGYDAVQMNGSNNKHQPKLAWKNLHQ